MQGGEFRVSSLRVKNAVLHDLTDGKDEDNAAIKEFPNPKSSYRITDHQPPFVIVRFSSSSGELLNSIDFSQSRLTAV